MLATFMLNIAAFALGGIYDLFVNALGASIGWWVGHIVLLGLVVTIMWAVQNWNDIVYGFEIGGMKVWSTIVVVGLLFGQHWMYQNMFGFPSSGAFITSLMVTGYLVWQWYQLEPAKA